MAWTESNIGCLQLFATLGSNLDENIGKHSRGLMSHEGWFPKKMSNLGFGLKLGVEGSEWVLGAQPVIRSVF